jgi:glycosyltransferase involved in cell wall biosynthesis
MRFLFVKEVLAFPRSSGHDVHCFHMMRALGDLGHSLALATLRSPTSEALAGLHLERLASLEEPGLHNGHAEPIRFSRLQERFRSYWGIDEKRIQTVGRLAADFAADAVVTVGLNVLPYLGAVERAQRIWYAADEWAWHHLSQVQWLRPSTWDNLKQALVKGLYERAYQSKVDRVWVVSPADRQAMCWVAGVRQVDVTPNGVDSDHYVPTNLGEQEQSCVFWGRLDFGPNVQALEWFCRHVWPELRRQAPSAVFSIYGFRPTPPVEALARLDGIRIIPNLPDLRAEVARHQVVVLPFVSGGGIKNKLLEAASMGKTVVCSPRASSGLMTSNELPFVKARRPAEWIEAVRSLWSNSDRRRKLGSSARRWVLATHTWEAAARTAVAGLQGARSPAQPCTNGSSH